MVTSTRICLPEELNIYAVEPCYDEIQKLIHHPELTIDASKVMEVDAAGIQLLIWIDAKRQLSSLPNPLAHLSEPIQAQFSLIKVSPKGIESSE